MEWETLENIACIRTGQWCNQSSSNIILAKRLILDAWVGPGCAFTDWYITVLKIHTKIYKNGRQVKIKTFESITFTWSLTL